MIAKLFDTISTPKNNYIIIQDKNYPYTFHLLIISRRAWHSNTGETQFRRNDAQNYIWDSYILKYDFDSVFDFTSYSAAHDAMNEFLYNESLEEMYKYSYDSIATSFFWRCEDFRKTFGTNRNDQDIVTSSKTTRNFYYVDIAFSVYNVSVYVDFENRDYKTRADGLKERAFTNSGLKVSDNISNYLNSDSKKMQSIGCYLLSYVYQSFSFHG